MKKFKLIFFTALVLISQLNGVKIKLFGMLESVEVDNSLFSDSRLEFIRRHMERFHTDCLQLDVKYADFESVKDFFTSYFILHEEANCTVSPYPREAVDFFWYRLESCSLSRLKTIEEINEALFEDSHLGKIIRIARFNKLMNRNIRMFL